MKEQKKEPTKYDALTINDLEGQIEKMFQMSRESQREMYCVLEYLRTSNRFKENPRYKKAAFWEYLEDRFTIRQGTYRENVRAFIKFPEYAIEYGVGMVTKIDRVCGSKKIGKVMDEIKKESAAHKKPLSRANIETIIQKHRTVTIEKTITDWKSMYEVEKAAHTFTLAALKEANTTIGELKEQIERLRRTAETFGKMRDVLEGYDGDIMSRVAAEYKGTPMHA